MPIAVVIPLYNHEAYVGEALVAEIGRTPPEIATRVRNALEDKSGK